MEEEIYAEGGRVVVVEKSDNQRVGWSRSLRTVELDISGISYHPFPLSISPDLRNTPAYVTRIT